MKLLLRIALAGGKLGVSPTFACLFLDGVVGARDGKGKNALFDMLLVMSEWQVQRFAFVFKPFDIVIFI